MGVFERSDGMILMTTILILSLLAALVFSMQRAMWLHMKLHQKTCATHKAFEALETEALKLVRGSPKTQCLSDVLDVNHAVLMLQTGHGCVVSHHKAKYRYWLNRLGYADKQVVLAVHAVLHPDVMLSVRFSDIKGVMSWRYLID